MVLRIISRPVVALGVASAANRGLCSHIDDNRFGMLIAPCGWRRAKQSRTTTESVMTSETVAALVTRIQDEFLENPELALTLSQAKHRFGIDAETCKAVLEALASAGVLARMASGTYVRWFPRMAA